MTGSAHQDHSKHENDMAPNDIDADMDNKETYVAVKAI
jgi:hypothetical protein